MHQHVPKILGNVKHITATVRGPVTIRPYFNERNFSVISTRSFPRLFSAPKDAKLVTSGISKPLADLARSNQMSLMNRVDA